MEEAPPLGLHPAPRPRACARRRPRSGGRRRWRERAEQQRRRRSCAARRGAGRARRGRGGRGGRAARRRALARPALVGSREQLRGDALDLLVRRVAPAGAKQERRLVAGGADEHRDRRAARPAPRAARPAAAGVAASASAAPARARATRPRAAAPRGAATISSAGASRVTRRRSCASGPALRIVAPPRAAAASAGSRARTSRPRRARRAGRRRWPRPPTGRPASPAPDRRRTPRSRAHPLQHGDVVEQPPVAEGASRASRAGRRT